MRKTTEQFIEEAKQVHGDRYDYSKVEYVNSGSKVCIICPEHGEFWQEAKSHLRGAGCPKCFGTVKRTNEQFAIDAKQVHGDKYDYSKVQYKNNKIKVEIICPEHGSFWQIPSDHLHGFGCPACSGNKRMNTSSFIEKAKKTHRVNYDYSKVNYVNNKTKVCIGCPIHGDFLIRPDNFLNLNQDCPACNLSQGEKFIEELLTEQHIEFITQKKFDDLTGYNNGHLRFDFWLPKEQIAIEFNGRQHYEIDDYFGGEKDFIERQFNDEQKVKWCKNNNIDLIIIEKDSSSHILTETDKSNIRNILDKKLKKD